MNEMKRTFQQLALVPSSAQVEAQKCLPSSS
jgi:hypothetical protein